MLPSEELTSSTWTDDSTITPVSSTSPSIPNVDFAEYVENARLSRGEQRTADLAQSGAVQRYSLRMLQSTGKEQVSSAVNELKRWISIPSQKIRDVGLLRSWTGLDSRRASSVKPHHSTNRTASWIAVFLLINTACNDGASAM